MSWVNITNFFETARERYRIMLRRNDGETPPWTFDPVFQDWRFCCVHREDDRTTKWLRDYVRSVAADILQATYIFRFFNRIETGQILHDMLIGMTEWSSETARQRLQDVKPVVTGAYMIHTEPGMSKLDGVLEYIDAGLPRLREIATKWGDSLEDAHSDLVKLRGMGRFMAYEVITDLRWTPILESAGDINTWASAGPGCARGLGRVVVGEPSHFSYTADQDAMLEVMQELLEMSRAEWPADWRPWEMREVEHWACEFDKYERAREGAKLKRRFKP